MSVANAAADRRRPGPRQRVITMEPRKYYAVAVGRSTGVFTDWGVVLPAVNGYQGSKHKSFETKKEADLWLKAQRGDSPRAGERAW